MPSPSPLPILSRNLYREQSTSTTTSRPFDLPPPHHVHPVSYLSQLTSLLPLQQQLPNGQGGDEAQPTSQPRPYVPPTSFKNPWRSWHKPTLGEVWRGLSWGHPEGAGASTLGTSNEATGFNSTSNATPSSPNPQAYPADIKSSVLPPLDSPPTSTPPSAEAVQNVGDPSHTSPSLSILKPDFSYGPRQSKGVKVTWLGHAGSLVQLPALRADKGQEENEPVRLLFDPIFSSRCSPTQYFGPLRSYAPPCALSDLPPVHLLFISHSHYDHQDLSTLSSLWQLNRLHLRIFVPLGLKQWFVEAVRDWTPDGEDVEQEERRMKEVCEELDWWDEIEVGHEVQRGNRLKIVCTPAQHGSGRYGLDANTTLWCSWLVERIQASAPSSSSSSRDNQDKRFRVFFGGDTGFQFHEPASAGASAAGSKKVSGSGTPVRELTERDEGDAPTESAAAATAARVVDPGDLPPSTSAQKEEDNEDEESKALLSASSTSSEVPTTSNPTKIYPTCPLFTQLSLLYGPPHLSLLPISVGATLSFLKSYDPLPQTFPNLSVSLFPDIDEGLTGANHMRSRDAVRVLRTLREPGIEFEVEEGKGEEKEEDDEEKLRQYVLEALPSHVIQRVREAFEREAPSRSAGVLNPPKDHPRRLSAVAVHWGTFVSGGKEVEETLRSLEDACGELGVRFGREGKDRGQGSRRERVQEKGKGEEKGKRDEFLALDHGGSHWVPLSDEE